VGEVNLENLLLPLSKRPSILQAEVAFITLQAAVGVAELHYLCIK
jgi:hypothetical protein